MKKKKPEKVNCVSKLIMMKKEYCAYQVLNMHLIVLGLQTLSLSIKFLAWEQRNKKFMMELQGRLLTQCLKVLTALFLLMVKLHQEKLIQCKDLISKMSTKKEWSHVWSKLFLIELKIPERIWNILLRFLVVKFTMNMLET